MQEDKVTELLIDLSNKFSELKKDVEYIKSEMHNNYVRSDENDTAVRELVDERTSWAKERQDALKKEFDNQILLVKKENELQAKIMETIDERITVLENKEAKDVMSRWEQIKDKLFYVVISLIGCALFAYFTNFIKGINA